MKYPIIGFTGKQFAGKTSAAKYLATELLAQGKIVRVTKFAQPIYDMQDYIYNRVYRSIPKTKDRKLMQFLGTEWGRDLDPNLWVNIWEIDYKKMFAKYPADITLVDDVRFNNEAELITSLGGVVIAVESNQESRQSRGEVLGENHSSENGIDSKYIHATIYNDAKTLDDFYKNVNYLYATLAKTG